MEIKGQISINFQHDGMSIEIRDKHALSIFARIFLNKEETLKALSGLYSTDCTKTEVYNLKRIGKVHEHKSFIFPLNKKETYSRGIEIQAIRLSKKYCPKGWIPDEYYGSRDSFFYNNGKVYARTIIRRWVNKRKIKRRNKNEK